MRLPVVAIVVHDASMTDRCTPGPSADYLAGACAAVAEHLNQLVKGPSDWATADEVRQLAREYRARSAEKAHGARRECEEAMLTSDEDAKTRLSL